MSSNALTPTDIGMCNVVIDDILITGSVIALHCCKAHAKINRKMGNLTPCKTVTPKNFNLKLCIRDYSAQLRACGYNKNCVLYPPT